MTRLFFRLDVTLSSSSFESGLQLNDTEDTVVCSASLLRLSRLDEGREGPDGPTAAPKFAALFLPSTLVEASTSDLDKSNHVACSSGLSDDYMVRPSEQRKLSQSLLSMTHPFLGQNFTVKSVIRVRNEQHSPSDIVLLDLSHAPWPAVNDLLDATNGQLIHATDNAILQLILISHVHYGTGTPPSHSHHPQSFDIPTCPVCLSRIDPMRLGLFKPPNRDLCSKFCPSPALLTPSTSSTYSDELCSRQKLLRPWPQPSHCVCCRIIDDFWKDQTAEQQDLFCHDCTMQETLWVCMTCGFVGCGRYSNKHAERHFEQSGHLYSLELATLRIWDYVDGEFAHRPDLLECPSSPPTYHGWMRRSQASSTSLPFSDLHSSMTSAVDASAVAAELSTVTETSIDEKTPKKATLIGEEYEALLQSALEEQAQHYEGEISRLLATLTAEEIDKSSITKEESREIEHLRSEIGMLRSEIDHVSRDLLEAQAQEAGHRATSQRLLGEQQVTQEVLKKVREEAAAEHEEGRRQMDELEQQIADLTANQKMRDQFSQDEELLNAQIFGTTTSESKGRNKKTGKKSRRLFRK